MERRRVRIRNPHGLHLRSAAHIVKLARKSRSTVTLCRGRVCADSCSILQTLSLGAVLNDELDVIIEGSDEKSVAREIEELFGDGGGI